MLYESLGSLVTIGEQVWQVVGANPFGYWAECRGTGERIVFPADIVDGGELDSPALTDDERGDLVLDF